MHHGSTARPSPHELKRLRPSNAAGGVILLQCVAFSTAALWLASRHNLALWALGQLLLALSLVQWFALLHECGHETLFRSKWPHAIVGRVAGFFCSHSVLQLETHPQPPPQVDRLAGRRSDHRGTRAS